MGPFTRVARLRPCEKTALGKARLPGAARTSRSLGLSPLSGTLVRRAHLLRGTYWRATYLSCRAYHTWAPDKVGWSFESNIPVLLTAYHATCSMVSSRKACSGGRRTVQRMAVIVVALSWGLLALVWIVLSRRRAITNLNARLNTQQPWRTNPRDVEGFAEALSAGLLPATPSEPPRPVTINSNRWLCCVVGFFVVTLYLMIKSFDTAVSSSAAKGVISLAVLVVSVLGMIVYQALVMTEMEAGYCRIDIMVTGRGRWDPENRFTEWRYGVARAAQWDLRGLWRLDVHGSPVREPDFGVLPPGHYPSPNRPGSFEYWTGEAWMYRYRPWPTEHRNK